VSTEAPLQVTVWNEHVHERTEPHVAGIYPDGLHGAIGAGLTALLGEGVSVRHATLADAEHGLTEEVLAATDVLLWWGHIAHEEVRDEVVARVQEHVLGGMGLLVLHSAHFSKVFRALLGTTCSLAWRNEGERELVWTVDPAHPIARGVPQPLRLDAHETYGEAFDVPAPDELVFISSFAGGEVFRSGMTFRRGRGRIFFFSPGDQEYPIYHRPEIHRVLANGVLWAAPEERAAQGGRHGAAENRNVPRPDA
jgi:trehalose utilization protein